MNDNVKKWVDALRSGEFSQIRGGLHNTDGYCCLGVACELYRRETGKGIWRNSQSSTLKSFVSPTSVDPGVLVPEVQEWLSLKTRDGQYGDPNGPRGLNLAGLNDTGASFDEIANLIESEPEGLVLN